MEQGYYPQNFTFHSGYIPMVSETLHSILDIFQYKLACSPIPVTFFLYIPFWIYSNCVSEFECTLLPAFTFHSGYIPIVKALYTEFSKATLHSTLVSSIGYTFSFRNFFFKVKIFDRTCFILIYGEIFAL